MNKFPNRIFFTKYKYQDSRIFYFRIVELDLLQCTSDMFILYPVWKHFMAVWNHTNASTILITPDYSRIAILVRSWRCLVLLWLYRCQVSLQKANIKSRDFSDTENLSRFYDGTRQSAYLNLEKNVCHETKFV